MPEASMIGLAIVLAAGLFQGSFLLPAKWMRGWVWENYWVIFAASAYLICPWVLAILTIPDLIEVYRNAPQSAFLPVVLFGIGWGIGAVTFGLGVDALGLALGFAVILGVAATSGTLIPLLVMPPEQFSLLQGVATGVSLFLMLLGVAVCSFAGRWKEEEPAEASGRSYRWGVFVCVASGLLSACGNLGYAWGEPIYQQTGSGVAEYLMPNALWPLLTPPLFVCNAGYAVYLLRKNKTLGNFREPGSLLNGCWAFVMGIMWLAGMALYGIGAHRLGELGKSLGWAILMSSMILTANALGVLTGEWKAAPASAKRQLGLGIAILLTAIAGLGYANSL